MHEARRTDNRHCVLGDIMQPADNCLEINTLEVEIYACQSDQSRSFRWILKI